MINALKNLKEKIMRGTTTEIDVDVVNEAIAYIKQLEALAERATEIPSQEDFCMEPNSVNVTIQSAVINIYPREIDNPPL